MKTMSHDHRPWLSRTALAATIHCLTGCAIGEILGMVIGGALGWGNGPTIAISIGLAFVFGYSLTLMPLMRAGIAPRRALALAFASDTLSIIVMEVVDNSIMVAVPGAMDAGIRTGLFWGTMAASILLAGAAAFPLNRWLIARGRGHAVVHGAHEGHEAHGAHGEDAGNDAHAGHAAHAAMK